MKIVKVDLTIDSEFHYKIIDVELKLETAKQFKTASYGTIKKTSLLQVTSKRKNIIDKSEPIFNYYVFCQVGNVGIAKERLFQEARKRIEELDEGASNLVSALCECNFSRQHNL